ncbi:GntR family transcriptional regulator [Thomasclavelia sp.]
MFKYIDIADDIRNKIIQQEYTYGQKLPYEYALCAIYNCNKETMKKALDILVKEGLIIRRRGSGTFVKDHDFSIEKSNIFTRGLDQKYKEIESEIIIFEVISSDDKISKNLQIEKGSFVYHIVRFQKLDNKPYSIEIIYIPMTIIPDLKMENIKKSIYQYIEETLKLKIQSTHKTVTGHLSSSLEQEYLGLKPTEPYFQVEQTVYLSSGVIFQYSFTRFHYKDFQFKTVTLTV